MCVCARARACVCACARACARTRACLPVCVRAHALCVRIRVVCWPRFSPASLVVDYRPGSAPARRSHAASPLRFTPHPLWCWPRFTPASSSERCRGHVSLSPGHVSLSLVTCRCRLVTCRCRWSRVAVAWSRVAVAGHVSLSPASRPLPCDPGRLLRVATDHHRRQRVAVAWSETQAACGRKCGFATWRAARRRYPASRVRALTVGRANVRTRADSPGRR